MEDLVTSPFFRKIIEPKGWFSTFAYDQLFFSGPQKWALEEFFFFFKYGIVMYK